MPHHVEAPESLVTSAPVARLAILLPAFLLAAFAVLAVGCADADRGEAVGPDASSGVSSELAAVAHGGAPESLDPRMVAEGRRIFRFDDFGDSRFWTDTMRLNELVEQVSPNTALALGLKVDVEAIPPEVLEAVLANPELLDDPAITRALLELDAVLGLRAEIEGERIARIGTTCALCHSSVDDTGSPLPGVGQRRDGWANTDLAVGTILSLTPGLPVLAEALGVDPGTLAEEFASWPPGFFDPRVNLDGRLDDPPVVIPPAYGLRGVGLETFTAEGPVSYWNQYVAVTQMRGVGSFRDPRLGVAIRVPPHEDRVRGKLPALRQYQLSLAAPEPPAGFFDPEAAERGRAIFEGDAGCASCHVGPNLTDGGNLHDPSETGMEPTWAERGTTGGYRTTPLRALWQHAPYFHDGSAETLDDVVEHYDGVLALGLTEGEKADLVEYLKSL
ncbi:MAG: hypothetical protein ACOC8B_01205 [Gemmatimonadota bacterium]